MVLALLSPPNSPGAPDEPDASQRLPSSIPSTSRFDEEHRDYSGCARAGSSPVSTIL
jgi:hypothetical protein